MCWAQKGRVSFNLYSDYLLSYQIPSEWSQADCFSDSRCLPPPPRCIMIYSMTARRWGCKIKMHSARRLTLITWLWKTCRLDEEAFKHTHIQPLHPAYPCSDLVTVIHVQYMYARTSTLTHTHSLPVSRLRHHKECQSRPKDEELCAWADCNLCCLSIWYHSVWREPWDASVPIVPLWTCIPMSRLSAFWEHMCLSKEYSPPVISFSFAINKKTRE